YGPVEGIAPLREALLEKLHTDNRIKPSDDTELIVTAGANMAFLNAIMAIADPDDEIILLTPYYFNHEMTVRMLNCRVRVVDTDRLFHPLVNEISNAVNDRTRAIVTISPNNPTGAVYSELELREINELCRQRNIYHISDEAYEYFTWNGHRHYSVASDPSASQHTISLFSLSKSFGFAGWRIGYMLIPEQLSEPVRKVQDSNLICAATIAQFAALGAIRTGNDYCRSRQDVIASNRKLALDMVGSLECVQDEVHAEGAFYVFLRVDSDMNAFELCRRLIEDHGVAVIPGGPFGVTDQCSIRISYGALDTGRFELALQRLAKGLSATVIHC
ncbi:MAG: aminotransferase class I/II-fold pyridoxal phosphate-dependent enzyme, partial [Gammaproteobacteria bacterium]|nr:aminotransferase class I/II-fold pyridoxal phosphate-dependent enzyme [Gammaproteobacteria bacterium]